MKEITPSQIQNYLKENEFQFCSTHKKLCFPILKRIHLKMLNGKCFDGIKVDKNIIVDGHHRYICLSMLQIPVQTITWKHSPSVAIIPWHEVEIDLTEWETAQQIAHYNLDN